MDVFKVEIKEVLKRTVLVKADDEKKAFQKAEFLYHQGDIILDSDDYDDSFGTSIKVVGKEEVNDETQVY